MLPNLLPTDDFNKLVAARYGVLCANTNDTVVGLSVLQYGEYFESEVELFRQIVRPGMVVADVGANIGTHTLALARQVGPSGWVYAFEPQRIAFQSLCANMALNSIANADCEQAAVGQTNGSSYVLDLDPRVSNNFGGFGLGDGAGAEEGGKKKGSQVFHGRHLTV